MKKLYCVICGKYRKFDKPKISYLLEKTLILSIICSKCISLTEINNIITSSNNITLRKVSVKPYGFDKIYMDKDLIEDKLFQITDP